MCPSFAPVLGMLHHSFLKRFFRLPFFFLSYLYYRAKRSPRGVGDLRISRTKCRVKLAARQCAWHFLRIVRRQMMLHKLSCSAYLDVVIVLQERYSACGLV
uniref:Uncharacterized protein n=1 Tax=Ixodes ricinus TaxID=34613 RepID=A0A0K8R525_IXORI